ncbi:hypothetical protein [Arthrobacter monumenti]
MDEISSAKDRVRNRLRARIGEDKRRRKRRKQLGVFVAAPLAVVSATAGFALLNVTEEQANFSTFCYAGSSPDAPQAEVYTLHQGEMTGRDDEGNPVFDDSEAIDSIEPKELCATIWEAGFDDPANPGELLPPVDPAPPMVTCIRDDWRYAVFRAPGDEPVSSKEFCPTVDMRPNTIDVAELLERQ